MSGRRYSRPVFKPARTTPAHCDSDTHSLAGKFPDFWQLPRRPLGPVRPASRSSAASGEENAGSKPARSVPPSAPGRRATLPIDSHRRASVPGRPTTTPPCRSTSPSPRPRCQSSTQHLQRQVGLTKIRIERTATHSPMATRHCGPRSPATPRVPCHHRSSPAITISRFGQSRRDHG